MVAIKLVFQHQLVDSYLRTNYRVFHFEMKNIILKS